MNTPSVVAITVCSVSGPNSDMYHNAPATMSTPAIALQRIERMKSPRASLFALVPKSVVGRSAISRRQADIVRMFAVRRVVRGLALAARKFTHEPGLDFPVLLLVPALPPPDLPPPPLPPPLPLLPGPP